MGEAGGPIDEVEIAFAGDRTERERCARIDGVQWPFGSVGVRLDAGDAMKRAGVEFSFQIVRDDCPDAMAAFMSIADTHQVGARPNAQNQSNSTFIKNAAA